MDWLAGRLLWLVAGAGLATVFGLLGASHWMLDLFSHFKLQYAAALLALLVLGLAGRRWVAAAVAGLFLAMNLAALVPYYWPAAQPDHPDRPGNGAQALRVYQHNVNGSNLAYQAVLDQVDASSPDVVVLEEVNAAWMAGLTPLLATHPHTVSEVREDNYGIALFSRLPLVRQDVLALGDAGIPAIDVSIQAPDRLIRLLGIHVYPPMGKWMTSGRNRQLADLGATIGSAGQTRGRNAPTIVLGDFNATPWSTPMVSLMARSGLRDCRMGRGLQPTWPDLPFLLRIPIDHCLHTADISVVRHSLTPAHGSDHRGLLIDLE